MSKMDKKTKTAKISEMRKMDKKTKTAKISEMRKIMKEYDRRGDVVLRDQMKRTIEEAKDTW